MRNFSDDCLTGALVFADRSGEIFSVKYRRGQRGFYLQRRQTHEILLLKRFASATDGSAC